MTLLTFVFLAGTLLFVIGGAQGHGRAAFSPRQGSQASETLQAPPLSTTEDAWTRKTKIAVDVISFNDTKFSADEHLDMKEAKEDVPLSKKGDTFTSETKIAAAALDYNDTGISADGNLDMEEGKEGLAAADGFETTNHAEGSVDTASKAGEPMDTSSIRMDFKTHLITCVLPTVLCLLFLVIVLVLVGICCCACCVSRARNEAENCWKALGEWALNGLDRLIAMIQPYIPSNFSTESRNPAEDGTGGVTGHIEMAAAAAGERAEEDNVLIEAEGGIDKVHVL